MRSLNLICYISSCMILAFLIIASNSCKNEPANYSSGINKPAAYKIQLDSTAAAYDICDAIDDISFVELERNDSIPISQINKVIVVDSICFTLDKKLASIKRYSRTGKYLGSIGNMGIDKDKGEYIETQDLIYRPLSKTLWLFSNSCSCIMEYGLEGNYIRRIQTDLFASSIAANDSLYYYYTNNNTSEASQEYNIVITDTSKRIRDRSFPTSATLPESIAFSGGIVSGTDYILFNPFFNNIIYRFNGLDIEPAYEINFGKFTLPQEMIITKNVLNLKINDYSYLTPSIALISDILVFGYQMNHKRSWAFFNKKNNHVALYKEGTEFPEKLTLARFSESNKQLVAFLTNADDLLKLNTLQIEKLSKRFPSFKSSLTKIKDASNPVLLFITPKDF